MGGLAYNWGVQDAGTTTQQLAISTQITVTNLPAGVTVTSINYQVFMQNRQGQTSAGPGAFYIGNPSSSFYKNGQCTAVGCSVQWTGPQPAVNGVQYSSAPGAGWSSTVTNTVNNTNHTYSSGLTYPSWDLNLKWSPTSSSAYTLTTGTNGCTTFKTSSSGGFGINYTGVTAPTATTSRCIYTDYHVTVNLSNGQTLTYISSSRNFCN